MIKKFLSSQLKTITSAAAVLAVASLFSRFLGLIRDRLLAGTFGAGQELDIYYAAFRVPDLVYSLLVMGAISAGFIPIFTSYLKDKNKRESEGAWYLANNILNLVVLMVLAVTVLAIIWAPSLIKLVAPGFSEASIAKTVTLTRIMFLSPLILGVSAIFSSILQSFHRFLAYSLAPIMYNLGIILGIIFFVDYLGLIGLAWGVVLGALLHLLVQLPIVFVCGFRWRPVINFKFEGTKRVFKMMLPRVLGSVLFQVNFWLMTAMASFLAAGSVAIYNLSFNIWSFPLGIIGLSFVLASFPVLSEYAQNEEIKKFRKTFFDTASKILFFTLPAGALFISLRLPIIRVVLGSRNFTWEDTLLTSETLAFFSVSVFAEALILLFVRGFFAFEDAKTPFLVGFLATMIKISAAYYLSAEMGVSGLALGFSLGSFVNLILLFLIFNKKILKSFGDFQEKFLKFSGKVLLISALVGLASHLLLEPLSFFLDTATFWGVFLQGLLAGLFGIVLFLILAWFLKVRELSLIKNILSIKS